jgi:hypothetical protein
MVGLAATISRGDHEPLDQVSFELEAELARPVVPVPRDGTATRTWLSERFTPVSRMKSWVPTD